MKVNKTASRNSTIEYVQAIISTLAQLTPVTAVLAEAGNQYIDIKRWQYIEEFVREVISNLKDHEERLCELRDITDPEANLHLMYIAINKVEIEYQEARRKDYAKLFVNCILTGNQFNYDEKRMFINLFDELSDVDIYYLSRIYKGSEKIFEDGIPLGRFRPNLIEALPFIMRLESRGLISERINPAVIEIYEENITDFDREWKNKAYGLTPLGKKLCKILIDPNILT
ncbi:MAG TPA: hypothetical protein VHO92_00470 [Methanobacterium sp.]|nr:hypothetical protein [Methanobacterium sp.]